MKVTADRATTVPFEESVFLQDCTHLVPTERALAAQALMFAFLVAAGKRSQALRAARALYEKEESRLSRSFLRPLLRRILFYAPSHAETTLHRFLWRAMQKHLARSGIQSASWLLAWESFLHCLPREGDRASTGVRNFHGAWFVDREFAWERMKLPEVEIEPCERWLLAQGLLENGWIGESHTTAEGSLPLLRLTHASQRILLRRGNARSFPLSAVMEIKASPRRFWPVGPDCWLAVPACLSCEAKVWLQTVLRALEHHCSCALPRWRRYVLRKGSALFLYVPLEWGPPLSALANEELVCHAIVYRVDEMELFARNGYDGVLLEKGYLLAITGEKGQAPLVAQEDARAVVNSWAVSLSRGGDEPAAPRWRAFVENWKKSR